jgi:hypothetical protein
MKVPISLAFAAAVLSLTAAADERQKVDAALILLLDASGSISAEELDLARESHVRALTSAEVLGAIAEGEYGRIAVAYVEFADRPETRIGWMVIDGADSAEAFVAGIPNGPVSVPGSMTGVGPALLGANLLFDALPYDATRLVVDVVGDGRNNVAPHPIVGRRMLLERGAIVNAMPLMLTPDDDRIDAYFASEIVAGPGHFVVPVAQIERMPSALRSKIVLELY